MPSWRFGAALAAVAAYALLSHLLMTQVPDRPWAVAALFGPLLFGLALAGLVRRHVPTLIGCCVLTLVLVLVVARGGGDVNRLYVLQHAAINGALGWTFAMTLRPGATALITLMAERIHDRFSPEMRAYTRWLTGVWVVYFAVVVALSLAIYAFAPWSWWSLYGNVITPLSAALLFVGEHAVRYRRHPEFERATLAQAVRAYRAATAARVPAARVNEP